MTKLVRTAHLPGQGPARAICGDCAHFAREGWHPSGKPHQWCRKALEMLGKTHEDPRKASGRLQKTTAACKYFIEKGGKQCAA